MVALYTVSPSGLIGSADIDQLVNTLSGNQDTPVTITNNDPLAYTLSLKNTDAASKALLVTASDGSTILARVQGSGMIASPDGTTGAAIVTTSHNQTLSNKTLAAPVVTGGMIVNTGTLQANGLTSLGAGATVSGVNGTITLTVTGDTNTAAHNALVVQNSVGAAFITARNDGYLNLAASTGILSFFQAGGSAKQTVTGSRGGVAALASLIGVLVNHGLLTDGTTA